MKNIIIYLCLLLSLALGAQPNRCELFLQGIQASLHVLTDHESVDCAILSELASFRGFQGSEMSEALGYLSFWDEVFLTNSTRKLETIQTKNLTVFYQAVSEEDYYTLGTQVSELQGFSSAFDPWISIFFFLGFSDNFWTWQQQGSIKFQSMWNEQIVLFYQDSIEGVRRFDPAISSSSSQTIIAHEDGDKWTLIGSVLIRADYKRLRIFDNPAKMERDADPKKIVDFPERILSVRGFSMKRTGKNEENADDFIFIQFENSQGGITFSNGSKTLYFPIGDVVDSIVVKMEREDRLYKQWQYKNFLITCDSKGEITLISFFDDLKFETTWVIRDGSKKKLKTSENLSFIRTNQGFLLFFNSGEEVFWYDLTNNLRNTKNKGPWTKVLEEKEVSKMLFLPHPISDTADPEASTDYLSIVVKDKDDNFKFRLFDLSTSQLLPPGTYIESIRLDGEFQVYSIQHALKKRKHTKEGEPFLIFAATEFKYFGRNILHHYEARWNSQKKMYVWNELDDTRNFGSYPTVNSVFTFPQEKKSFQNPNFNNHRYRLGVSNLPYFAYTAKGAEVLPTAPIFGQSLYWKQATVNNQVDWYLPGGLQIDHWCWASVASMIFNFNRRNEKVPQLTQCEVVSKRLNNVHNCCEMPRHIDCDTGGRADKTLQEEYNFKRVKMGVPDQGSSFSFSRVKAEIDNNRLMTASKHGKHVVLIYGYREDPNSGSSGGEFLLTWNPTRINAYHGQRIVPFDAFIDGENPSIYVIHDPTNS